MSHNTGITITAPTVAIQNTSTTRTITSTTNTCTITTPTFAHTSLPLQPVFTSNVMSWVTKEQAKGLRKDGQPSLKTKCGFLNTAQTRKRCRSARNVTGSPSLRHHTKDSFNEFHKGAQPSTSKNILRVLLENTKHSRSMVVSRAITAETSQCSSVTEEVVIISDSSTSSDIVDSLGSMSPMLSTSTNGATTSFTGALSALSSSTVASNISVSPPLTVSNTCIITTNRDIQDQQSAPVIPITTTSNPEESLFAIPSLTSSSFLMPQKTSSILPPQTTTPLLEEDAASTHSNGTLPDITHFLPNLSSINNQTTVTPSNNYLDEIINIMPPSSTNNQTSASYLAAFKAFAHTGVLHQERELQERVLPHLLGAVAELDSFIGLPCTFLDNLKHHVNINPDTSDAVYIHQIIDTLETFQKRKEWLREVLSELCNTI